MPHRIVNSLLLIFATAMSALGQSPASELQAAVADLERLPPETRAGVRYLSLLAIPEPRRVEARRVVSYTLNALSRVRTIAPPTAISSTLVRLSISNYVADGQQFAAWSAAWEKLAEADPYWHLRTEVLALSGPKSPARQAPTGRPQAADDKNLLRQITIDGDWLDAALVARLKAGTLSSGGILRADDFIARATTSPLYYDFAGIPATQDEFLKTLGIDSATIDRLRANAGANLMISGVTQKPRRVVWMQGPLGGVYQTLDVQQVDAERDPFRRPLSTGGVNLKFDAGEWFALAPNGLWRVALYDAAGRQQQTVPDKIAKDTSDPSGDGIVAPLISCIRCHTESGLRPFRDDQTRLFSTGRVDFRSYDPAIVQRATEFYDEPRLARQMEFDRQTYAQAVLRATGLKPEPLAVALARVVREFAYLPMGSDQAARELGLTSERLTDALAESHDPILLTLVEGRPVLRGQWESSYAEAARLTTGRLDGRGWTARKPR